MPGFISVLSGPSHVYEYVNEAYVAISGQREFIGRGVREVFPELEGQGVFELLDQVYATGRPFSADSWRSSPRFLDDLAPCNGMMPPADSEMISPP